MRGEPMRQMTGLLMFPIMLRRPRSIVQAIPICMAAQGQRPLPLPVAANKALAKADRKSTRLNSSHGYISYAVFCLKKKNTADKEDGSAARDRLPESRAALSG